MCTRTPHREKACTWHGASCPCWTVAPLLPCTCHRSDSDLQKDVQRLCPALCTTCAGRHRCLQAAQLAPVGLLQGLQPVLCTARAQPAAQPLLPHPHHTLPPPPPPLQVERLSSAEDFLRPVPRDTPGYRSVIRQPMDLGTAKRRLAKGKYSRPEELLADTRLVGGGRMWR